MINTSLPYSLSEANFYTDDPFTIFEMDNFLPNQFYENLLFSIDESLLPKGIYESKGNKKKIVFKGNNLSDLPTSPLKKLIGFFLSEEFFRWFVKTHLLNSNYFAKPVFVYDSSKVNIEQIRQKSELKGIESKFYETVVHYSSMKQNDFIPPHTDSKQKRLSLVLYLPSEELPFEMQKGLGTIFYKARRFRRAMKNYDGLLSDRKTKIFLKKYEIAHVSLFKPNRCVGFIKNDISWHAVAPNNFYYDRRAIVINVMEL